jgi:hypothetical protein
MDKKERIEEEVQKTLQCFEDFEKIEPNPFFLTRLKARIRSLEAEQAHTLLPGRRVWFLHPAVLSLLIVANLFSAILVLRGSATHMETDTRSQYIAAFAEEYLLNQEDTDLYSLAN